MPVGRRREGVNDSTQGSVQVETECPGIRCRVGR